MEEELKATRQIMARQKEKYDNAANEIRDLQKEHNDEKEDLMIQLRQQDLDIKFYRQVVDMVMKPEELAKLKSKSLFTKMICKINIQIPQCLKTNITTDLLHNMKQQTKEDRQMILMHSSQDLELKQYQEAVYK